MYIKDLFVRLTKKQGIPLLIYIITNIFIITMFINLFAKILEVEKPTFVYFIIAIIIYAIATCISLSSIGEGIMRLRNGCKKIKRQDQIDKISPIYNEVYARAKKVNPNLDDDIQLYMYYGEDMNAFAMGRKTICVSEGILNVEPKYIKSILAHEFGHISNKDTAVLLLIASGDVIISNILTVLSVIINGIAVLARGGANSKHDKDGWLFTIINAVLVGIIKLFSKMWAFWGILLVRKSTREDEFRADQFAYTLGYGKALCEFLDKEAGHNPPGILAALKATHPDKSDRISNVQNLIKKYGNNPNGVDHIANYTVDNKYTEMLEDNTNGGLGSIYKQYNEILNLENENTVIKCTICGKELEKSAQFCSKCGNKIEKQFFKMCPKCGKRTLDDEAEFCIVCGTKLSNDNIEISKIEEEKIITDRINNLSNQVEITECEGMQDDIALCSENVEAKQEDRANRIANFIIGIFVIIIIGCVIFIWNHLNKSSVDELLIRNIDFNESMSDILKIEEKNKNTELIETSEKMYTYQYNLQGEVLGLYDDNATLRYSFTNNKKLSSIFMVIDASKEEYDAIVEKVEKKYGKGTLAQTMNQDEEYEIYEVWRVEETTYLLGYRYDSIVITRYNSVENISLLMISEISEPPQLIDSIDGAIISIDEGYSYYYKDNKYYEICIYANDIESVDYEDDLLLINFTENGSKKFEDFTIENIGKETHIVYKGDIVFSPTVEQVITGGQCTLGLDDEKDNEIAKEIAAMY